MHRHIRGWAVLVMRLATLVSIGAGLVAMPPVAAGQEDDAPPLDLAAVILHGDDLNWLLEEMDLLHDDGWPYGMLWSTSHTTIDDAVAHENYAMARGGFTLSRMGEDEAADLLDETGWVRSQDELLALPEPGTEDEWSIGVAVTIEEFATDEGAEAALKAFDDAEVLADITVTPYVEQMDLPPGFEDRAAAMWKVDTTRYSPYALTETVSLWVQVDTFVVSVALLHGSGYVAPDPDLLVPLVELQLKRLEHAEHLYQPQLATCTPTLTGDHVVDFRADYPALNGQAFANVNMTFDDLLAAQQEIDDLGLVDSFIVSQSISETDVGAYDGTLWFQGRIRAFVDEEHAAEFLASTATVLEEDGYTEIDELGDVPDLGDGAVAYTYLAVDEHPAAIMYVQVGAQVFSIRLGSTTEAMPDAVFELAELQIERLESGTCNDPLPVPRDL